MTSLAPYNVSIAMDFTSDFGAQHETVKPSLVYQDVTNPSDVWRTPTRMWHPLTEHQFGKGYRVGDTVMVRLLDYNGKVFRDATIVHMSSYDTAKSVLGSYNATDAFKGIPFTHVLVLDL